MKAKENDSRLNLTVDPELRDLLPPLDAEELKLLEDSILQDGRAKVPLTVWNGIIIDGHNRWSILQRHPEIPYEVDEVNFPDRNTAIEWMYRNQLGRRNLSDEMRSYVRGKLYESEKRSQGGTGANQHTAKQTGHRAHSARHKKAAGDKTAERIGKEYGVNARTIRRDADYATAVDMAESIVPGFKNSVLSGSVKVTKKLIKSVCALQDGLREEALNAIKSGDAHDAEKLIQAGKSIQKQNVTLSMRDVQDVEFEPVTDDDPFVAEQATHLQDIVEGSSAALEYFVNEMELCQKMSDECKAVIIEHGTKMISQLETILQNMKAQSNNRPSKSAS